MEDPTFIELANGLEAIAAGICNLKATGVLSESNVEKLNTVASAFLDKVIEQLVPKIDFSSDEKP